MKTFEKTFTDFDSIALGSNAHARFHLSQTCKIIAAMESDFDGEAEFALKGNVLFIGAKMAKQAARGQLIVDIYAQRLNNVSISGSGAFEAVDSIQALALNIAISGYGKVILNGSCENSNITVTGIADIDAYDFRTFDTTIVATGIGGEMRIWAVNSINAAISGDTKIVYKGDPKVSFKKYYGNASIEKLSSD